MASRLLETSGSERYYYLPLYWHRVRFVGFTILTIVQGGSCELVARSSQSCVIRCRTLEIVVVVFH